MIERLIIENFRSIRRLDIELKELCGFIGYNNSGKSNILDAIDIIMGEKWPTDPFDDKDFYNYIKNPIKIEVRFRRFLRTHSGCKGFRLTYDGTNRREYVAIDKNGNECYSKFINTLMKNEASLLYIGLNRTSDVQLRSTKWTIYGKLLRYIESDMDETTKNEFKTSVETSINTYLEPFLRTSIERIKNYTKDQTGIDLEFEFNTLDPLQVLKISGHIFKKQELVQWTWNLLEQVFKVRSLYQ